MGDNVIEFQRDGFRPSLSGCDWIWLPARVEIWFRGRLLLVSLGQLVEMCYIILRLKRLTLEEYQRSMKNKLKAMKNVSQDLNLIFEFSKDTILNRLKRRWFFGFLRKKFSRTYKINLTKLLSKKSNRFRTYFVTIVNNCM